MSLEKETERIERELETAFARRRIFDMSDFRAEPLGEINAGYIGLGFRGKKAVSRALKIPNVKIRALCDLSGEKIGECLCENSGLSEANPKKYFGKDQWRKLCEDDNIDLVYIATPWREHAKMAVYAMQCGKHAAVEVPAAFTLAECLDIVNTAEKTRRHCFQLSNCAYDKFELAVSEMSERGIFGEVFHAEGSYIHEILSYVLNKENAKWRWAENFRSGNLYPQHAIMPLIKPLKINRGDDLDFIVSVSSGDFSMRKLSQKLSSGDDFYASNGRIFRGNINTSILKTKKLKTLVLQHDISTPRPYDRKFLISGEKYYAQKYPLPAKLARGTEFLNEKETEALIEMHTPGFSRLAQADAEKSDAAFSMDYLMDWRLYAALNSGESLDFNVYDAAASSAITDLSVLSVLKGSAPVKIPAFNA